MGDQAQQRPDFNGSNYDDTFVGDLVNFVASNSFQSMFEQYFLSHALYFTDDEEHKLEYMEYYQEFHGLFEKQLEVFCTERGYEQGDFLKKCNEASTDDPKAKHYIQILLSSVEYDTFVKLMKIMRPVAERRKRIEAALADTEVEIDKGQDGADAKGDGSPEDAKGDGPSDDAKGDGDAKGEDEADAKDDRGADVDDVKSPSKEDGVVMEDDGAKGDAKDEDVADSKGEPADDDAKDVKGEDVADDK